jgi:putative endonuclease
MKTVKMSRGECGEDLAVDFLVKKGYRILQRNYRYGHGEIDIIAEWKNELVFVEVKTRLSKEYGDPEDAVTVRKRLTLRNTAEGFMFENNIADQICRFDVIAIEYDRGQPVIRHLEDAF